MIHKIKSLYDNGNGASQRQIAKELGISRNTVTKYLGMPESEISLAQEKGDRNKKLDGYRQYIIQLLQAYPGLSAVKVLRKLKEKVDQLDVSDRSVRRYIKTLKQEVTFKQKRYYEPILDMVPAEQCQVDGGELRGVMINGVETTVYLMVFVLSYSRLMYVAVSDVPITTKILIAQHDAAFRYFGGMPKECLYDQTKLVVISETFRELNLNQRFYQYATAAGFTIRACEGYDPESKGKVEAGVKYAKHNGLYGEEFSSWPVLEAYMLNWLDSVANVREHAVTKRQPWAYYQQMEQSKMLTYLAPSLSDMSLSSDIMTRKVDKTGLISYKSNKYSVPLLYQQTQVGIKPSLETLFIHDLESSEIIAEHVLCLDKGKIFKNRDHYRDKEQDIAALEAKLIALFSDKTQGVALCKVLKSSSSVSIHKDQLRGAHKVINTHLERYGKLTPELLERVIQAPYLTAVGLKNRLEAYHLKSKRPAIEEIEPSSDEIKKSEIALASYANLNGQLNGQEVSHVNS